MDNSKDNPQIDLKDCLNNLEEIKNGCLERSGSVRIDPLARRNASPMSRSHRHSSQNLAAVGQTNSPYNNVNNFQFVNSTHQKRSQSPYSINNAYLSPPPSDGHWRRTNSDSALHQSTLLSTNQTLDVNHLIGQQAFNSNNGSPRRSPAMVIDNSANVNFTNSACSNSNGNAANWDSSKDITNVADKFLLSASLPDQHHRPRSCEVPGINIYPSQDENNLESGHHHIPISSNTGSLPDLTNLHFPVPLHAIDSEEQAVLSNGVQSNMISVAPNSPYSNGPDSPFSPGSSHNSNLSPPPPCNMMGNYSSSSNQSPGRQSSPGPSPSPTSSRRRAHHNVNNLVIGNHRHQQQQQQQPLQAQSQVCYTQQHTPPQPHIPPRVPSYLSETNQQYHNRYKSPPRITVEVTQPSRLLTSFSTNKYQQPLSF